MDIYIILTYTGMYIYIYIYVRDTQLLPPSIDTKPGGGGRCGVDPVVFAVNSDVAVAVSGAFSRFLLLALIFHPDGVVAEIQRRRGEADARGMRGRGGGYPGLFHGQRGKDQRLLTYDEEIQGRSDK